MAKTDNTQENLIDQPSEDVIDLSEDQVAKEAGEELVSAEKCTSRCSAVWAAYRRLPVCRCS